MGRLKRTKFSLGARDHAKSRDKNKSSLPQILSSPNRLTRSLISTWIMTFFSNIMTINWQFVPSSLRGLQSWYERAYWTSRDNLRRNLWWHFFRCSFKTWNDCYASMFAFWRSFIVFKPNKSHHRAWRNGTVECTTSFCLSTSVRFWNVPLVSLIA